MKLRIAITFLFWLSLQSIFGQRVLYERHRFGYSLGYGMSFNTSKSDLLNLTNKTSGVYTFGGTYEYQLNLLIAFRVGLNLKYSSAKFYDNATDSLNLFYYSNVPRLFAHSPNNYDEIAEIVDNGTPNYLKNFGFESRNYRFGYLSLPLEVLFRTKMKNYTRYYLKFGAEMNLRIRARAKELRYEVPSSPSSLNYLRETTFIRDINRFKFGAILGLGFEKNYIADRTFYIDIEGIIALNNSFSQKENMATILTGKNQFDIPDLNDITGKEDFTLNHLWQHQLVLKVGFLF